MSDEQLGRSQTQGQESHNHIHTTSILSQDPV